MDIHTAEEGVARHFSKKSFNLKTRCDINIKLKEYCNAANVSCVIYRPLRKSTLLFCLMNFIGIYCAHETIKFHACFHFSHFVVVAEADSRRRY